MKATTCAKQNIQQSKNKQQPCTAKEVGATSAQTNNLRARRDRVLCLHVTVQVALLASGELALLANVRSQLLVNLVWRRMDKHELRRNETVSQGSETKGNDQRPGKTLRTAR